MGQAGAEDGRDSLVSAIASGNASLAFRYRFELVDQDSFDEDANASTLRLRLNYETGKWQGWSGFVEFDHVMEVLVDDFNSGAGTSGRTVPNTPLSQTRKAQTLTSCLSSMRRTMTGAPELADSASC